MMLKSARKTCEHCEYELLGFHDRTAHFEADALYSPRDTVAERYRLIVFYRTIYGPLEASMMLDEFGEERLETQPKSVGIAFGKDAYITRCNDKRPATWRHDIWIESKDTDD